ncbi:hypothetical protein [Methanogenium organophilum]|uniref:Uncharacterized protein n=1 Tax=Methanogenium organophilum TaxID=2199 RepID=A0A9X9S2N0_METOG|nr:hypothetical protein [Methanogenium organophilum]WAI00734.1 hypothetical protein OU421_09915 [Methanogenium organophilum]
MNEKEYRLLKTVDGTVQCLPGKKEEIVRCRFCIHSKQFLQGRRWVPSPARAFCLASRTTTNVDLSCVTAVCCNDMRGEGFSSVLNVIS